MIQFHIVRVFVLEQYSNMDGFPSGQRGQTVNLLQIASVVRIHLHPFAYRKRIILILPNPKGKIFSEERGYLRGYGGIGRRKGLKIPRGRLRAGSSPATRIFTKLWKKDPGLFSLRVTAIKEIINFQGDNHQLNS